MSLLTGETKGESGDSMTYAVADKEVKMSIAIDCGAGTIVEEADKHTN